MTEHELVRVEWEDSHKVAQHWEHLPKLAIPGPLSIVSVGFLLRGDHEVVALAASMTEEEKGSDVEVTDVICIPRSAVKRIVGLDERVTRFKRSGQQFYRGGQGKGARNYAEFD